jgi:hypothetical protein
VRIRKSIIVEETRRTIFISETVQPHADAGGWTNGDKVTRVPSGSTGPQQGSTSARVRPFPVAKSIRAMIGRWRRFMVFLGSRFNGG